MAALKSVKKLKLSVAVPEGFDADPDHTFQNDADPVLHLFSGSGSGKMMLIRPDQELCIKF